MHTLPINAPLEQCRTCGTPLEIIPGTLPLWVRCGAEHFFTADGFPVTRNFLTCEMSLLRSQAALLYQLAADALRESRPFLAANFHDRAEHLLARMASVRALLSKDSGSLVGKLCCREGIPP